MSACKINGHYYRTFSLNTSKWHCIIRKPHFHYFLQCSHRNRGANLIQNDLRFPFKSVRELKRDTSNAGIVIKVSILL